MTAGPEEEKKAGQGPQLLFTFSDYRYPRHDSDQLAARKPAAPAKLPIAS